MEKSKEQWDKIKFKNNLGPQIGGLLHDAVALTIAEVAPKCLDGNGQRVKYWLDILYEIAENKKAELLKPKPVKPLNEKKAVKMGKDWQKKQEAIVEEGRQKNAEDKR